MEFVSLILQPVVDTLKVFVKKHIVFMTSCKKYVTEMDRNMGELNDKRVDVKDLVEQKERNKLKIPAQVSGWLKDVQEVDAKVESLREKSVGSCFSFKTRHGVGKRASGLIEEIKHLTEKHSKLAWNNQPIIFGEVDSMKISTSSAASIEYENDFESRKQTFIKALKALEPTHKSQMIALCGMGGVGKTTMMEKLKTVVTKKGMFKLIVEAVIGEKPNLIAIQDAVADCLENNLEKKTVPVRAVMLREWFKEYSKGGNKKILVILDDVWEPVDLNDIGLSPLPNQGVDFKVLLTSRNRDVCTRMGVVANSILNVNVLEEAEAQDFFWKFIEDSGEDPDLRNLGDDIVRRCQGLPIAIKTIAITLRGKRKGKWEDTLTQLQHLDIDEIVNEVFELSYNNLKDKQTKSVLLLCGLYPEDFDIPTEELVRYGWGFKLFKEVYTINQARNRGETCIDQLVNANLLIESNRVGSIKMHDLVRAFVLKITKVEHASIVNHGNMSEWPANDTPDSCKRISLACNDMEEFPGDFKYPNLSFLKLTHGDKSLRFPENFYGLMEKLQVIVYEEMEYPLLPGSFEYSINLRTLCLHECSLMFDCHSIGSLENLEVLSFANCSIRKLPSTIGNLKKLKLLDLTGCVDLRIDDGVLKNLVKLEELYMRVADEEAINFTDGNFNELAECSKILFAIEIELFGNNTHLKRMSFNKLERFKISIGRFLEKKDEETTSFENTLMLVSNKGELLESGINMLFEKTVVLHLQVDDMDVLEDFKCSSFHGLRVLNISKCAQLRYLFTHHVASTLSRLEHLEVWSCDTLQTIIHDENNGSEPIKLPSLKFLSLSRLPKLAGLCNTGNIFELPQLMELQLDGLPEFTSSFPDDNLASSSTSSDTSTMQPFLNEKVAIPRLETLRISRMNKLSKIWSSENVSFSMLKTIGVEECDTLQTIIHDENNGSEPIKLPSLEFLSLRGLPKLAGLCNTGNIIELPQLMELQLDGLPEFTSIFPDDNLASSSMSSGTSTMQPFLNEKVVIPRLETLRISRMNKLSKIWSSEVTRSENVSFSMLKTIGVEECDRLVNVFPRNPMPLLHHLKELSVKRCDSIETIFKIDMGCVPEITREGSSSLVSIVVRDSQSLRHVWSLENVEDSSYNVNHHIYGFEAVESIEISGCGNFRNVFTPITADFNLKALQKIDIDYGKISSVESNPDQQNNAITRDIAFSNHVRHTFHELRTLTLKHDRETQVVFDIESTSSGELMSTSQNNHQLLPSLENLTLSCMDNMRHVWNSRNWKQFFIIQPSKSLCQNLTNITLYKCRSIKYLLSPLMFKFLSNLKDVDLSDCEVMEEIVSNRDDDDEDEGTATSTSTHTNVTTFFPILEKLELHDLKSLQHIGGGGTGSNQFQSEEDEAVAHQWSLCQFSRQIELWHCSALSSAIPSYALAHMQNLEDLIIGGCESMKDVFEIKRRVVVNDVRMGEGSGDKNNNNNSGGVVSSLTLSNTTTIRILPDLSNLRKLIIFRCPLLRDVFPFSTLQSLTKLQHLCIAKCDDIRVIVKELEEEDGNHTTSSSSSSDDHHQLPVVFPSLKSLYLFDLPNLEGFFLGRNDFRWPVLDTVVIRKCPKMRMFTKGRSDSPMLKYVVSDMGKNSVECGKINNLFHHPTTSAGAFLQDEEEQQVPDDPSLDGSTTSLPPISPRTRMPWFYNNLIKVHVRDRDNRRFIIGHNELQHVQKIEKIKISSCSGVKEIFETLEMDNGFNQSTHSVLEVREMDFSWLHDIKCLWKSKQWTVLKFPNLTRLSIHECWNLKHVFTISMVGSLLQLQELHISKCRKMEIIVVEDGKEDEDEKEQNDNIKEDEDGDERRGNEDDGKEKEDDDDRRENGVEFRCLRKLTLFGFESLKGFCLGMETIHWPSLDTLEILRCPKITTFTNGQSTTPKLRLIKTDFGLCDVTEGVNSFIRTKIEEGYEFKE